MTSLSMECAQSRVESVSHVIKKNYLKLDNADCKENDIDVRGFFTGGCRSDTFHNSVLCPAYTIDRLTEASAFKEVEM